MAASGRLKRILVGFDGSREAGQAVELAIGLGAQLGAELALLSVLPDTSHLETLEAREQAEHAARARLEDHLGAARSHADDVGVHLIHLVVIGGEPADAIAHHAFEHGFDLVVIGSHGRERDTHGGLGRVVERLVRAPICPVLIAAEPPTT